jgi:hypothetical protein
MASTELVALLSPYDEVTRLTLFRNGLPRFERSLELSGEALVAEINRCIGFYRRSDPVARGLRLLHSGTLPEEIRGRIRQSSARWYAGSAIRTAEKQIAGGEFDAAGTTLEHLPRLLELLPRAGDRSLPLRRAGVLQDRLRSARRRAA